MSDSHWLQTSVSEPLPTQHTEMCAKGISFRSFFSALERIRGDEIVTRTIEHLPDEVQEAVMLGQIAQNDWHPISWYRELHRAARAATGEGPELARLIGYESMCDDFSGPLRALAFVLSPESVIRRGPRLFRSYYRPGRMYLLEAEAGLFRAHWSGCVGFDLNVWQDIIGGCEAVLRVCGAHNIEFSVLSGAGEHDSRAEVLVLWS